MTTTPTLNDVDIEAVAALTEAVKANPDNGATNWKVQVDWKGAFLTESRIRGFSVPTDEPPTLGGADTAPNPVELLLASLGSCYAVGLAANATAAGIDLRELSIELDGDLDLGAFLGLSGGHAGFSGIRARIHLDTDADPAAVDDLISRVVSTSPVGHTLTAAVAVDVTRTG